MGSIDTRLHRLEAMVAGLLAWQNLAERQLQRQQKRLDDIAGAIGSILHCCTELEARVAALEADKHALYCWIGYICKLLVVSGPEPADSAGKSPGGPLGSQEPEHREHQQRDSRPAPAHPHDCIHTEVCHPYAERGVEACPCKHYDTSPAPAQAAQPAPPHEDPIDNLERHGCGYIEGDRPAPHPLEADLDSPDFDKFCAEVRGKPAPQLPRSCEHVWSLVIHPMGNYERCLMCGAIATEPRGGGG